MKQQPFLPLFFGDFLASTAEWAGEEQALYLLLLGHQWALGSIPMEDEKVRRLSRWERGSFKRAWATVRSKFNARDGRLFNERLEEHRDHAHEISKKRGEAGSKGAAKRYGKPVAIAIANATPLPCHPNQTKPEEKSPPLRSGPKDGSRARPAKRCPTEFVVTQEMRAWAESECPGLNVDAQTAEFRDHEYRTARSDWPASWRNWIRRSPNFSGVTNGARGKNPQPRPSSVERVYAATDAWLLEQQSGSRVESDD